MLVLLFPFNLQTLQNFSKHQIQKNLSCFEKTGYSFQCAANTREVFHSDTLHETPLIQRKDHADSCYKNMHSVRKCIQIQMCWLHFKYAPQQSADCCVWPSNRALSPCSNSERLSQNLTEQELEPILEQAWLECCLHISCSHKPAQAHCSWATLPLHKGRAPGVAREQLLSTPCSHQSSLYCPAWWVCWYYRIKKETAR